MKLGELKCLAELARSDQGAAIGLGLCASEILELIERVERLSQCLDIIRVTNLNVLDYAETIAHTHKGLITYGPDVPLGEKK